MRIRSYREHNYKAFLINDRIAHVPFDPTKPIEELIYPEHYIIKIEDAENPVLKIQSFFGDMGENELPFSVFIDGDEPTAHDHFIPCLKEFYRLGIDVSYITNGLFINQNSRDRKKLLTSTSRFCKEVIVRCKPDLHDVWSTAVILLKDDVDVTLRMFITGYSFIQDFLDAYQEWEGVVKGFELVVDEIEDLEYFSEATVDKMNSITFMEKPDSKYTKVLDLSNMKVSSVV